MNLKIYQNIFIKFIIRNLPLILVLCVGVFLRFYNYPNRISFDRDASLDALVARSGSQEFQLPLSGPFSSAAPITTGPWYYYQMIIANILIQSMYAPWISFALSSLILVCAMYKVGTILKNKRFGLVLAFIATVSPVQISISTGLGNASLLGQFTGIIIWLFLEIIINKKQALWEFLLGFMVGLSLNYHFQAFLLIPFFSFLLFKRQTLVKSFLYSMFGLIISFLPLLFFELNNHWYNLSHSYNFIILGQNAAVEIKRWATYVPVFWNNLVSSIIGIPKTMSLIILFTGIAANFGILIKSKISNKTLLIPIIFLFQFLFLRYYRGPLRDNYVQFFHPFIFIFYGSFLYVSADITNYLFSFFLKTGRYLVYVIQLLLIIIFTLYSSSSIQNQLKPNGDTASLRLEINQLLKQSNGNSVAIYRCNKSNMTKPWSVSLYLDINNKLWKEKQTLPALKIGYIDKSACINKYTDADLESIDLSKLSDAKLLLDGWEVVTPKSVYESMTKWWYKEMP